MNSLLVKRLVGVEVGAERAMDRLLPWEKMVMRSSLEKGRRGLETWLRREELAESSMSRPMLLCRWWLVEKNSSQYIEVVGVKDGQGVGREEVGGLG